MDVVVRDGEYEYLMETDPNFRKFVAQCEGLAIEEILGLVTKSVINEKEC